MSKDPKRVVKEIISLVGKTRAERLLITAEVSPSAAYKLVREKYLSEVGEVLAEKITKARGVAEIKAKAG